MAKEPSKDKSEKKTVSAPTKTIDASIGMDKYSTAELLDIISEKDALIAEKDAVISELLESNASVATTTSDETVEVAGQKYIVTLKAFIHAGKRYTKAEILANPTLAAELIEKKSPALKKA